MNDDIQHTLRLRVAARLPDFARAYRLAHVATITAMACGLLISNGVNADEVADWNRQLQQSNSDGKPAYVSEECTRFTSATKVTFALESKSLPGVTRYYARFSEAADESDARVYGGMHFRSATHDRRALGDAIGVFVAASVAQPDRGTRTGPIRHAHPHGGGW